MAQAAPVHKATASSSPEAFFPIEVAILPQVARSCLLANLAGPFYREGFAKGTERGLDLGLSQGRKEGLRAAVETAVLGIELTEGRKSHLAGLEVAGLEALRLHLKQHRSWPT